jgi:hypothetical protein
MDPIRRLTVVAAGVREAVLVEAVLDAPYEAVWKLASDLEGGVPRFEPVVRAVHILEHRGERLQIVVETQSGLHVPMAVLLRDGYCLMHSASASIGMAARPEGARTRIAHFEWLPDRQVQPENLIEQLQTIERLAKAAL